ncbi:FIG01123205: hypothetical protein [hydrothermal vent metagenome]|uniref:Aminobenzoate oxygenase n=1 Tax=hydrothermal vent metagenome TaxID=652676 RepID=A0A3B0SS85_9ZZZZ
MLIRDIYAVPNVDPSWHVPQTYDGIFDFNFDTSRETLMHLYQKGKDMQWDALKRIDWDLELDPENPMQMPLEANPIYGTPLWDKLSKQDRIDLLTHGQAWNISQFLQGEQGALICASKIVTQVPTMDAKFYAATQTMDEARHIEAYEKLQKKFGVAYPMTAPLQELINDALKDSRWDITYLAMQIVIEGLALAAFATIRDVAQNPLAQQVNAYVMQDEARHVMFGRLSLRDYYPHLSDAERDEREEFLVDACYHMRDRFQGPEIYERLGLPVKECVEYGEQSETIKMFRTFLFQRIVPVVKDIGLWGPRIQKAYTDMGVIGFADMDVDALHDQDDSIAKDFDARQAYVESVISEGKGDPVAAE